jgi:hypothetical protein
METIWTMSFEIPDAKSGLLNIIKRKRGKQIIIHE